MFPTHLHLIHHSLAEKSEGHETLAMSLLISLYLLSSPPLPTCHSLAHTQTCTCTHTNTHVYTHMHTHTETHGTNKKSPREEQAHNYW